MKQPCGIVPKQHIISEIRMSISSGGQMDRENKPMPDLARVYYSGIAG
jgi:hypothetical protein